MSEKLERARTHKIILDLYDYDGQGADYSVTLTIDESRLGDVIGKAIKRHDGKTELAAGAFIVQAVRINQEAKVPAEKSHE